MIPSGQQQRAALGFGLGPEGLGAPRRGGRRGQPAHRILCQRRLQPRSLRTLLQGRATEYGGARGYGGNGGDDPCQHGLARNVHQGLQGHAFCLMKGARARSLRR